MKLFLLLSFVSVGSSAWVKEMEDPRLFEGDMVLSPEQLKGVIEGDYSYGTSSDKWHLWPFKVPYMIDSSLQGNSRAEEAIEAAIEDYEKYTCFRFEKHASPLFFVGPYLRFVNARGCSSPVGNSGGRNSITLGRGCWSKGVVIHEMMHSFGVYHEQSRPDRDSYVKIHWENISPGLHYNFFKAKKENVDSLGTPYDYRSIMHYSGYSMGGGKISIETLDPKMQNVIGNRKGFSSLDIKQLNLMYQCTPPSTLRPFTSKPVTLTVVMSTAHPSSKRSTVSSTIPTRECKDNFNCGFYVKMGYCKSKKWKGTMKKHCRKSCRFC